MIEQVIYTHLDINGKVEYRESRKELKLPLLNLSIPLGKIKRIEDKK